MQIKTAVEPLQKARERYFKKHGLEPHIVRLGPKLVLAANVVVDELGIKRVTSPIEPFPYDKSLTKLLEELQ